MEYVHVLLKLVGLTAVYKFSEIYNYILLFSKRIYVKVIQIIACYII